MLRRVRIKSALVGQRKLHFGCGGNIIAGWANLDAEPKRGAIGWDLTKTLPVADHSVDFIFAEHFIEHVTWPAAQRLLADCARFLAPGGVLRLSPSLTPLSNFPTLSISCELKKSRVALHPRRKGWLGTFSAPLRIPLKGPYGSGKSQWGLDNIMALQIIFQNTAAISAIFPEFVTVSSGKVLKWVRNGGSPFHAGRISGSPHRGVDRHGLAAGDPVSNGQ